ncbi:uncharacterized protein HD556DRAFT_228248 [Suillus plorans]|uniref:DUF6533 domain-containing protein n=1 Tax=Suillus plorans TaxID=116603 RepID=A0A9P7DM54_9AGAM|nr:uncharacterized protein HD556DRAFT_228248 [Suillus plorans]KAG1798222.1 hypothetical protein HD556DRAFT_228248 [Suillus plorans]
MVLISAVTWAANCIMTIISNDPSWWPLINSRLIFDYFIVAASVGVIYDWMLAFGKEVELIWNQHLSLMTVLYFAVRYAGITYAIVNIQMAVQIIPLKDAVLVLLVVVFTAIIVANIVMLTINMKYISAEQVILSGTYQCIVENPKNLDIIPWILIGVWEIFTLCLAVPIALKHFRELGRHSAGGVIRGCFVVLMKTHLSYFDPYSSTVLIHSGVVQLLVIVQSAVLGPRLVLGVREYHAKLMIDSDTGSGMISIASQDRAHVLTSIIV